MPSKTFKGRPILPGNCEGEALVSRSGFNTLASFQKSVILRSKKAICSDQNNADIYQKEMTGKILCIPQTIGSTTGGLVLQTIAKIGNGPKAILFSEHIDSLAAAGVIMADIWGNHRFIVVDQLGPDFLSSIEQGQTLKITEDGTITIQ